MAVELAPKLLCGIPNRAQRVKDRDQSAIRKTQHQIPYLSCPGWNEAEMTANKKHRIIDTAS